MKELTISALVREGSGKEAARALRKKAQIPAVVYGAGLANRNITVHEKELSTLIRHKGTSNALIHISMEGDEKVVASVVMKSVQRDPVTERIIHVDFENVDLTHPIVADVPVKLMGIPIGVKDFGGILQTGMRYIKVRCLIAELPEAMELDVTPLRVGHALHVSDLVYPGLEILSDAGSSLAQVIGKKAEEVVAPTAEQAAADAEAAAAPEEAKKGEKAEKK